MPRPINTQTVNCLGTIQRMVKEAHTTTTTKKSTFPAMGKPQRVKKTESSTSEKNEKFLDFQGNVVKVEKTKESFTLTTPAPSKKRCGKKVRKQSVALIFAWGGLSLRRSFVQLDKLVTILET